MHKRWLIILAGLYLMSCLGMAAGITDTCKTPGTIPVSVTYFTWKDPARHQRDVPVKIYYPETNSAPTPVILFSHGLGGSREGYEY